MRPIIRSFYVFPWNETDSSGSFPRHAISRMQPDERLAREPRTCRGGMMNRGRDPGPGSLVEEEAFRGHPGSISSLGTRVQCAWRKKTVSGKRPQVRECATVIKAPGFKGLRIAREQQTDRTNGEIVPDLAIIATEKIPCTWAQIRSCKRSQGNIHLVRHVWSAST